MYFFVFYNASFASITFKILRIKVALDLFLRLIVSLKLDSSLIKRIAFINSFHFVFNFILFIWIKIGYSCHAGFNIVLRFVIFRDSLVILQFVVVCETFFCNILWQTNLTWLIFYKFLGWFIPHMLGLVFHFYVIRLARWVFDL